MSCNAVCALVRSALHRGKERLGATYIHTDDDPGERRVQHYGEGAGGHHTSLVASGAGGTDVLANDGAGNFSSAASFPSAPSGSTPAAAIGDFNGDGYDDIAGLGSILWGQSGGGYVQQNIAPPPGSGAVQGSEDL